MPSFPRYAPLRLSALIALTLMLTACPGTMPTRSLATKPPQIACESRAPAEPAVAIPVLPAEEAPLDAWKAAARAMRAAALGWVGIATVEVEKRVTTANCLDDLRDSGVIR